MNKLLSAYIARRFNATRAPTVREALAALSWPVLLASAAIDLASKAIARSTFTPGVLTELTDGFGVSLQFNTGAAAGLLAGVPSQVLMPVLMATSVVMMYLVAVVAALRPSAGMRLSSAMVVGGGVGNLFERLFSARGVTDFISVRTGPGQHAVFNYADLLILGGSALFLLALAVHKAVPAPVSGPAARAV